MSKNENLIISPEELKKMLDENKNVELLDTRNHEKHDSYNIGGKNIPLVELSERYKELDPNKLIVTYCMMGNSSMRAAHFLLEHGFKNVKSLDGGMTAWKNMKK